MAKRVSAFILALAMLLVVFALSAYAAAPEELAGQYAAQTRAVLQGGQFTVKLHNLNPERPSTNDMVRASYVLVSDGGRAAAEVNWGFLDEAKRESDWLMKLIFFAAHVLTGDVTRGISTPEACYVTLPGRGVGVRAPGSGKPALDTLQMGNIMWMFAPLDAQPQEAAWETAGGKRYLRATYELPVGKRGRTRLTSYYYLSGKLKRVVSQEYNDGSCWGKEDDYAVDVLKPEAETDYFKTSWFRISHKLLDLYDEGCFWYII